MKDPFFPVKEEEIFIMEERRGVRCRSKEKSRQNCTTSARTLTDQLFSWASETVNCLKYLLRSRRTKLGRFAILEPIHQSIVCYVQLKISRQAIRESHQRFHSSPCSVPY
ncbi:hypothetical protein NE237_021370 [Protea cynaroides]|uniref:Uncharacterized protein n=1 Tax=Protea cynaroides TaxID=273540 RepID=A0A9Q0K4A7_9MAGN|nr:hypothetical protein NE237_021370 [Protea cynaroides]